MMKKYLLFAFFLITLSSVSAQDLTKQQTIDYLLEKFKETEDLKMTYDEKYTFTITEITFKKHPTYTKRILFTYRRNFSDNTNDKTTRSFDPQYIVDVKKDAGKPGDAVGYITVSFTGRNVVGEFDSTAGNHSMSALSAISFPYLLADPLHAERVMKAFMHLKNVTIKEMPRDIFVE